jgi:PEGA domain
MRGNLRLTAVAALLLACGSACFGQETEQSVMTPSASLGAHVTKPSYTVVAPERQRERAAEKKNSAFITAPKGLPPEEVNRKELEENAGPNGGKLLLRSVPDGADIFINGRLVGQTPMLLVVAPGKYKIDMRGPRQEFGTRTIGLVPRDTQTVVIDLKQRYPSQVRAF